MTFEITILGCGAAAPTSRFNPSAQVVNVHDKLFLVDCGEGTQMQIRRFRMKMQRIHHVFISHLHGDHYLGLLGLISSLHLLGRSAPLHLYGPPDLKEIVDTNLRLSQTWLIYPLVFHPVAFDGKALIMEDNSLEVYSFPLRHRIECAGYFFVEKPRPRGIVRELVKQMALLPSEIISLKNGEAIKRGDGTMVTPDEVCEPARIPRSYAYCSDTAYWEPIAESIRGVSLLYHESTFLNKEQKRARDTHHSTAEQAAQLAAMADAKSLLLGHFSSRYDSTEYFLDEARPLFPNVQVAEEGKTYQVPPY